MDVALPCSYFLFPFECVTRKQKLFPKISLALPSKSGIENSLSILSFDVHTGKTLGWGNRVIWDLHLEE